MEIKSGADFRFLCKEIASKLFNIEQIFLWNAPGEYNFTGTAGSDGKHMVGSRHYTHQAIDIRTWYYKDGHQCYLDGPVLNAIVDDLRTLLGNDYDIVVHPRSHLHLEFDPK